MEIGKIYRILDLDNRSIYDAECVDKIYFGNEQNWVCKMSDIKGLSHEIDSNDNIKILETFEDWPEDE